MAEEYIIGNNAQFNVNVDILGKLNIFDDTNIKNIKISGTTDLTGQLTASTGIFSGLVSATNVSVAQSVTATTYYGSGANLTGVSGPEVYGFTGIGSNLQVRTTNGGVDDITSAQYDAFEQVLFAPSGMTFSINNNGNLIATF